MHSYPISPTDFEAAAIAAAFFFIFTESEMQNKVLERTKELLSRQGITSVGMIPIEECDIIKSYLLPDYAKSAIMISVPYRCSKEKRTDGFSEYAGAYDYHEMFRILFSSLLPLLEAETGFSFAGFSDHSPINEKIAAAKCGIGIIGRNSLFIDRTYGSFVFIGTIITDAECFEKVHEVEGCENCMRCVKACPGRAICEKGIDVSKCLSGISQKKKKTDEEKQILKLHHTVWGCDICQNVCPHNINAKLAPHPYFSKSYVKNFTFEFLNSLSDEEFNKYPFAYKGRKIVLENMQFI